MIPILCIYCWDFIIIITVEIKLKIGAVPYTYYIITITVGIRLRISAVSYPYHIITIMAGIRSEKSVGNI
jgi:hypothetical protein